MEFTTDQQITTSQNNNNNNNNNNGHLIQHLILNSSKRFTLCLNWTTTKQTTHAQYIIRVDKTNIDYNNKGSKMQDSHMEIILNNKKKCTQELMINYKIKKYNETMYLSL